MVAGSSWQQRQRNYPTHFFHSYMFATKLTHTSNGKIHFHEKLRGKTFQPTRTRWAGNFFHLSWTGEYQGPMDLPPLPRQGSHRTEPDYDSPGGLCRCKLLFTAWKFTLIVCELKSGQVHWNVSRHIPLEVCPQSWSSGVNVQLKGLDRWSESHWGILSRCVQKMLISLVEKTTIAGQSQI